MHLTCAVVLAIAASCVNGYPNIWSNTLNPVHGLYVKPSTDGSTGDLYVAATEDSGVKSQWVVDKPVNFLPVASAAQQHAAAIPVAYASSYPTSHDESSTQKRAVMPTPQIQYAYAAPVTSGTPTESSPATVAAYPYAYPVPATPTEGSTPKCEHSTTTPQYPYQFPFNYFYPQMMSAYSNAMSILKDAGLSDDMASSIMAQASPMWSPSSYAYPMYVMVDPKTWNQNQAATTTSTPAPSAPTAATEENSQV